MARVRTFLALDVGDSLRQQLASLQDKLRADAPKVQWVAPDNFHVTLLFLGDVDDRNLMEVCRAADMACRGPAPFSIALAGVGCFPNLRRPRTVWAGIGAGADEVGRLHQDLATAFEARGLYRPEDRPFAPHVTLGRIGRDDDGEAAAAAFAKQRAWKGGETAIGEVLILASDLTPKGPEYTVLGRVKLKEAGR